MYPVFLQMGFMVVIPVLFFIWIRIRMRHDDTQESITQLRLHSQEPYIIRKSGVERLVLFLSQKGVHYRSRRRVGVSEYKELRLVFGLVCTAPAMWLARAQPIGILLLISCAAFVVGYYLPDLYYLAENHDDNQKILRDMHNIYDTLRVYLAVDVFITDALDECYRRVGGSRLKAAIYELKEGLRSQSEQLNEIEAFRLKFDNPHINQLANLLSQYYRSGNVNAMMEDLSEQMTAIDHAIHLREKERMEMKALLQEVCILIGLLGGIAVALYFNISDVMADMF